MFSESLIILHWKFIGAICENRVDPYFVFISFGNRAALYMKILFK